MSAENEDDSLDSYIITRIQEHPLLYDKSLEEYHKEHRTGRQDILVEIADNLSEKFDIKLDGAKQMESTWQLDADLKWLVEYVDHLPQMTNDDVDSTEILESNEEPALKRKKKKSRH
ncbi:hypothetical protein QAD02_017611 [Eretmocerus hayati]|uniref:Uncharacterized protein n=1 Tax=Eretmocerus hayati TaxID=131215 RepID=A0ACC2PE33_9HYME|nr:hypothetical protein QAD02_017611 [Eretmocerus hayati]